MLFSCPFISSEYPPLFKLKGSGNFSAWVIEACRRRLINEKYSQFVPNKDKHDQSTCSDRFT
ncbi:DUF3950 domain-containing protein [Escherichia coli]|uniref:DUF3950 domain-containing protein n=1 Tax=Escherichia coli TaxID=562 RepID=UPI00352D956D